MAEDASKEIKKVAEETKNIVEQQKKLKQQVVESTQVVEKFKEIYTSAMEGMRNQTNQSFQTIQQITQSIGRLNVDMVKLSQLSKEGFENLVKQNKEELEANTKQLEALSKDINKRQEQLQMYEKRAELILEESALAKAKVEQEYILLESSIKNNEDYGVRVLQLHKEKQEKISAIDKETVKKTSQNAADIEMILSQHGKNAIDKVIEHSGEVVQHTGTFWKGVLDIGAQKEHLDTVKKQYQDYLKNLKSYGDQRKEEYQKQIELAQDAYDVDKVAQLANERDAFEAKHNKFQADETKRITTEVAKIEKAGQAMRLEQWKNHAENAAKITKDIAEKTKMAATAISGIFAQQADMYKDQIAKTSEDIANNTKAQAQAVAEFKSQEREILTEEQRTAKEEELAQLQNDAETATGIEKENLNHKIADLQDALKTENDVKKEFEEKDKKLQSDKSKAEEKQKKAQRNEKRINLGQQIVEAVANVAAGVAKAIGLGPFIGPVMAAIVGAAGAVQVGIMTKQLAKLEDGGLLHGKRHSEGGMRIMGSNIEVEGGEYVVNRKSTKKNLGLIDYINSQNKELTSSDINSYFSQPFDTPTFTPSPFIQIMQDGGQVPMLPMQSSTDVERLLAGMQQIKLESRVSVTDINTVQDNIVKVDEWVGL